MKEGEADARRAPSRAEWIEEAVSRYEEPLCRYATGLLSGDRERARDAVQETFLRLCRADRAEVEERLRPWLFTVCRSRALDRIRKEKRLRALPEEGRSLPAPAASPDGELERLERDEALRAAVAALPQRQREVVRLKFAEGMSYREIAETTGLSRSNVGYLIHQGVRALRERFGVSPEDRG